MKRIVLLSALEPWSMAGEVGAPSLFETLKGYARAGWQVDYLTSRKHSVQGGSHERDIDFDLPGVTVRRFEMPALAGALGGRVQAKLDRLHRFPKQAAAALARYLAVTTPDVIYAYEEGAIAAVARLARHGRLPAPVVHRFQGTILGERHVSLLHCLRKYESWRALRCRGDFYVMTDDGTLGDRALRFWNRHVTAEDLLFLRNGIDRDLFGAAPPREETLRQLGLPADRLYLLAVSRLAGWKRVDRAIRIVAALAGQFPALQLLICGDGEVRGQLEALAGELGVARRVQFLGSQPRPVISRLMSATDVFLSLYDISNCGNPLFEALLSGCCVVTLDNGGTGTVIRDGYNGRLVPLEREAELPGIVARLLASPDERAALSSGARNWAAREMRTWDERMRIEIHWLEERLAARAARLRIPCAS